MKKRKGKPKSLSYDEAWAGIQHEVWKPWTGNWKRHPEYRLSKPPFIYNGCFDMRGRKLSEEERQRHCETIARRGTTTYPRTYGEDKMTVSISVSESGGNDREFKVLPAGPHNAACQLIADLGLQETPYGDKHKVYFRFEVPGERIQYEKEGVEYDVPMSIGATYTLSLNERANLRKFLEAWRGKQFTKEELEGFELTNLLGKPVMLIVTNKVDKEGKTRAYIDTATRSTGPVELESEPQAFGPSSPDLEQAPNWIQEAIGKGRQRAVADEAKSHVSEPDVPVTDDDIPF